MPPQFAIFHRSTDNQPIYLRKDLIIGFTPGTFNNPADQSKVIPVTDLYLSGVTFRVTESAEAVEAILSEKEF